MTSIRNSMVFSLEDDFGKGKGNGYAWIAPPPGSYFDHTNSRNVSRIQSTGTKIWDTLAYGKLEGTWNWNFILDYNYLEPLFLVFEKYRPSEGTPTTIGSTTSYTYTFSKTDSERIPSFCVRRVILNRMAGGLRSSDGGLDEIVYLKGCVCESITFSRAAGQSQMTVSMNGFYAHEVMEKGQLSKTDHVIYSGNLMEYTCLFINGTSEDDYVANTESLSLGISNSAEAIFNVCTPFAKEYCEGISKYTFSTTAYSNDPSHYQQRVYSGGYDNTALQPKAKGMKPIPKMYILGYNQEMGETYITQRAAYDASPQRMMITITECAIKSLQWRSGDSEKLQDVISSTDCQQIEFTFASPADDFSFTSSDVNALGSSDLATFN